MVPNEMDIPRDRIEKYLALEDGRSSRGADDEAEYVPARRRMPQEWADMVDAWANGEKRVPTLSPAKPFMGERNG